MSEAKRKLEELRRKNAEAKEKLAKKTQGDNNSNNPTVSSLMAPKTTSNSDVDQIIKEANKAPADINLEEIKKMTKRMTKFTGDNLGYTYISESILGKTPEMYEEGVQCKFEETSYDSENEDDRQEINVNEPSSYRKSVMLSFNKKNTHGTSNKKYTEQSNAFNLIDDVKKINESKLEENFSKSKVTFNEDMRRQVLNSQELSDFLTYKTKYVERALGEKDIYDMFKTYHDENDNQDMDLSKRAWVSPLIEFNDENCIGRAVTSLEWSLKHQELLLAAYSKTDEFNVSQSNGLIHLWSLALRKSPEFTFTCQTEITSAIFHKFIPKLVIGATYTGQILIWDTRGKPLPVQKTPPGGKFHSHPIYCLGVTGTLNANNIISVSNDGVLCTWSLSNLSKPTKRIELKAKKKKFSEGIDSKLERNQNMNLNEEIGAICMATQENETNNIFLGSDDSDIYQIYVHQSNDNVDNVVETYRKHNGPIHSLDMHPGDYHKNSNFSHLMLSSSADWSVSMWSKNFSDSPLFTFDNNDDYVYDAKFHPTNPSLFACVDGLGKLDFWDLNKDVEVPVHRYDVGNNSLNKMAWSQDGKRMAVGDISGKITVLNVEKELYTSKPEDSLKFEKIISIAKNNKKQF